MLMIYCADPMDRRAVDADYAAEAAAASAVGLDYRLIDFEALLAGNVDRAIRAVRPPAEPTPAVYRGWMLPSDTYGRLYDALADRGCRLINTPEQYRRCHELPGWYDRLADVTPRSVWLPLAPNATPTAGELATLLQPFGDRPVIVKDYVKSRKHEWLEACYIPSAADTAAVERVVRRCLELQGDDLAGGLVCREFVRFEPIGTHSRSGMPLTHEFRLFVLDGTPILVARYWEEGDYAGEPPPLARFRDLARRVDSRFFTLDVAKQAGGDWLVVELGDGQVAGLPETAAPNELYAALAQISA